MFHTAQVLTVACLILQAGRAADAPGPVPLAEARAALSLPEGFSATLFAGEPDVVQPIAMTTDARGRLWVVECFSYPDWTTNQFGSDRVSIYEDADLDGRFDKKTVFWDKGRNLSGIALGFGGVWLCSLPELIFVPDRNYDDQPDRGPEVVLDGWDMESKHNVFSNLTWGPDGWLYGCNGILGNSLVGPPGADDDERTAMNCGVWRYHPTRRVFEVVAHGTTNPWGIAFDEWGQIFVANCVIKHLFHMIPGARYERMFGQDFNPNSFELIPSVADHIHWSGGSWNVDGRSENPRNDLVGGGHAHSGAMIYLGGTWPAEYRNTFLTINIHGHRVNKDILEQQGSGYVARHGADFLRVNDTWFRGVSIIPAHDGGAYVCDWSDAGECHDYEDIHRENGRIYKIQYGDVKKRPLDLRKMSESDLVQLHSAKNEWLVNQSRLVLQERAEARDLQPVTGTRLRQLARFGAEPHGRLRALWALHAIGKTPSLEDFAADRDEYMRAWSIQLALEDVTRLKAALPILADMAANDPSPVVRLYLASALQRLAVADRVPVAMGLVRHGEDANDHNLPLMIWYGIEPVVGSDAEAALKLLEAADIPKIRRFIAQRLSLRLELDGLVRLLEDSDDPLLHGDVVNGMLAALNGRRDLPAPKGWGRVARQLDEHPSKEIRSAGLRLSLIFGDQRVLDDLWRKAENREGSVGERVEAMEAIIQTRRPGLSDRLKSALSDPVLRQSAMKGLAAFADSETPRLILSLYQKLRPEERVEAVNTLSSRATYATELLRAVEEEIIPRRDLTPFAIRQIRAFNDPELEALLTKLGSIREISGDKAAEIARLKQLLTPAALGQADLSRGRAIYERTCASCHVLFGEGGRIAPELTGSQRSNLDYLLENIVDPNAVVWDQYKATYFETADDRLISGVVAGENESTVTVQTQAGVLTLPRTEIARRRPSNLSLMPEGLLSTMQEQEILDLVAYLQSPAQVPLPKEK